jgi:hypothetical protein
MGEVRCLPGMDRDYERLSMGPCIPTGQFHLRRYSGTSKVAQMVMSGIPWYWRTNRRTRVRESVSIHQPTFQGGITLVVHLGGFDKHENGLTAAVDVAAQVTKLHLHPGAPCVAYSYPDQEPQQGPV